MDAVLKGGPDVGDAGFSRLEVSVGGLGDHVGIFAGYQLERIKGRSVRMTLQVTLAVYLLQHRRKVQPRRVQKGALHRVGDKGHLVLETVAFLEGTALFLKNPGQSLANVAEACKTCLPHVEKHLRQIRTVIPSLSAVAALCGHRCPSPSACNIHLAFCQNPHGQRYLLLTPGGHRKGSSNILGGSVSSFLDIPPRGC